MAFLSSYKALLFDVDNTLVNSDKKIPAGIPELLTQLSDKGYVVGLCTGRSLPSLRNYILPQLPSKSLHIINGGSQVVDDSGDIKWQDLIPAALAQELCQTIEAAGAELFFVAQPDALYATPPYAANLAKHPWNIPVQPIKALNNWDSSLINILEVNDSIRAAVGAFLPKIMIKEMPYRTNKIYFDITAQGVTKAAGIQEWCRITGIESHQIIGFGDSANDLEFLGAVGYGVVMGNGTPEAKAVADRVINSVDDDGLVTYLTDILKGQPVWVVLHF